MSKNVEDMDEIRRLARILGARGGRAAAPARKNNPLVRAAAKKAAKARWAGHKKARKKRGKRGR